MLGYEEVKGLLLQGYEVKLPEWQGYWKMNEKQDGIEVHTKDGKVLDTPHIMYTFHNNWEIATVDNCPVLKKEKEAKNNERSFKIIDVTVFGATPVVVIQRDGSNRPEVLRVSDFEKLVGSRAEAMRMTRDFTLSTLPKGLKGMMSGMLEEIEGIINLAEEYDKENVEIEQELECGCDCPICRGEIDEIDEEDIMMIGKILEDITGGAIRLKAVEIARG